MTDLLSDVDAPSDAELISRVRGGDVAAYGELFSRHKDAANRLAKQLVRGPDADDLVSEAFAKVLTVLQGGGGPDVAFRAYLLTAVRRLHVDKIRAGQRLQTTDDMTPFDPGVPFKDTAVAGFETGAAAQAFASLPERWQLVLWHLEVEGQKPADIAPLLGMSANSVSALAYRAREGLRQAFLTMHLSDISETDCRWVNEHLGAFVRKGLSKRDATKVQTHLDGCRRCTAMYLELADVNSNLAGIIGPLLLGAAAAGYLASAGAGIGAGGVVSIFSRTKDFVAANSGAVAAGAVATGVAAAAVAAVVVTQVGSGNSPDVVADPPASQTSGLPSGATPGTSSSTNPSSSASPSASAPTSTLSASTSPSATLSATSSPSPGLALLGVLPSGTTDSASALPTDTAPSDGSTGTPGGPATEEPTPPPTEPPPPPKPAANLDLDASAGSVTVHVTHVGLGDTVSVSMQSHQTTFANPPAECTRDADREVTCFPGGTGGGVEAAAGDADYTVTLPLAFPDSMVDDDLTISVQVNSGGSAGDANTTFRPARTPTFDFSMPALTRTAHFISETGDVDRYDYTGTTQLPSREQGLQFTLDGNAHFRTVDGDGCGVNPDGNVLTCPDAADGSDLTLPIAADSLTSPADVSFRVSPYVLRGGDPVTFNDPDDTNNDTVPPVTLRPGADLSLPGLHVFSANPDRNGLVQLQGDLAGVRPGMGGVTYDLQGGATFPASGNPGCSPSDDRARLVCDEAANGAVALTILATNPGAAGEATVGVSPNPPFESVGADQGTTLDLPGRPTHDFSLADLRLAANGHNLAGDTDVYRVTGTVGDLPAGVDTLDFAVKGATVAEGQADASCARVDDGTVRCMDLDTDPNPVLTLTSSSITTHTVAVALQPVDPFDDPDSSNNSGSISVSPGVNLTLANATDGPLRRGDDGSYHATVVLGGVRKGMPSVFLDLGPGASYAGKPAACTRVSDTRLRCDDPAGGKIPLTIDSDNPAQATALSVTAIPGGDFEQLSDGNVANLNLRASYDFSIGDLTRTAQSVSGDTDSYTLHTTIRRYPDGVGPLTYTVTGARFAEQQGDCTFVDGTHVTCGDGPVDLVVLSTSADAHDVTVSLQTPAGYDDPDASNDSSSVSVQPGVDLKLADLDPDNESPANDDRLHRVATRLDGTRPGLGSVTYTLTGDATFVGANVAGCTASGKTLTCTNPSDGPITFTVRADNVNAATNISIAVSAPDPFRELNAGDNSDSVRLLPRPTYNFAMGALDTSAHTIDGNTDHFTIGSTVDAVPTGVSGLDFTVTGGTFAANQDTGCTRTDATHVTCTDLASARRIGFRVDSASLTQHEVTIALVVPAGYDDTNADDNSRSINVSPGIDLAMGALTPASPKRAADGTYTVSSVLTGVRGGAVRFAVTGATVTDSSCTRTSASLVTCASPSEGQKVSFTLRPDDAGAPNPVTIEAQPTEPFTELDPADNDASTTLTPPDVVLTSVTPGADALGIVRVVGAGQRSPRRHLGRPLPDRRGRRRPRAHTGPLHPRRRRGRRRGPDRLLHQQLDRRQGPRRAVRHLHGDAERRRRHLPRRHAAVAPARPHQRRDDDGDPGRRRAGHRQRHTLVHPALAPAVGPAGRAVRGIG